MSFFDVVHLGDDDQGIHEGGAVTAARRSGEELGLSAEGNAAQGAFGGIVRQTDAAVFEEAGGPAHPRGVAWNGAGGWLILSQSRQVPGQAMPGCATS